MNQISFILSSYKPFFTSLYSLTKLIRDYKGSKRNKLTCIFANIFLLDGSMLIMQVKWQVNVVGNYIGFDQQIHTII